MQRATEAVHQWNDFIRVAPNVFGVLKNTLQRHSRNPAERTSVLKLIMVIKLPWNFFNANKNKAKREHAALSSILISSARKANFLAKRRRRKGSQSCPKCKSCIGKAKGSEVESILSACKQVKKKCSASYMTRTRKSWQCLVRKKLYSSEHQAPCGFNAELCSELAYEACLVGHSGPQSHCKCLACK